MSSLHLKPSRPALIVRDPITREPLAFDGERKPATDYWWRRLQDGDAVLVAASNRQPAKTPKPPPAPPAASTTPATVERSTS